MNRTLVVYAHDRSFAADLARVAGMILGPSRVTDQGSLRAPDRAAAFVVIVDDEGPDMPFATAFTAGNEAWLRLARVALVSVHAPSDAAVLLISRCLGAPDVLRTVVPPAEQHSPSRVGRDSMEDTAAQILALDRARKSLAPAMPREDLLGAVEDYLDAHQTCVLAVASRGEVRAVPIEYSYENGHVYMITEGGEKLGHVLASPSVALTIFEPDQAWEALSGVLLTGRGRVHAPGSEEHARLMARGGLTPAQLDGLPAQLFVLDVTLHEAELVDARLREKGYPMRQTLVF